MKTEGKTSQIPMFSAPALHPKAGTKNIENTGRKVFSVC